MKEIFYRLAPAVLAITGFTFSSCVYFIDKYSLSHARLLLWGAVITVLTATGAILGNLIKKLHDRSYRDPLTGLQNRRYFYYRLACEMGWIKRNKAPLSLAIIDVDNFKIINDTYGHMEGDRVLTELANIFKQYARVKDTVTLWGGDEFAIILPETNSEGAKSFAERIRNVVENHNFACKVTISVGIACTNIGMDMDKFVELGDKALYMAKTNKNRVVCIVW